MAVPKVAVQGKVLLPSGNAQAGTIIVKPKVAAKVTDDADSSDYWVPLEEVFTIAIDGSVSFNIIPNDEMTPATTYEVTIKSGVDPDFYLGTEEWNVASSPDPIDIGAIPRV